MMLRDRSLVVQANRSRQVGDARAQATSSTSGGANACALPRRVSRPSTDGDIQRRRAMLLHSTL